MSSDGSRLYTKRHYISVANVLREHLAIARKFEDEAAEVAVKALAESFADVFAADSPLITRKGKVEKAFLRDRFLAAALKAE